MSESDFNKISEFNISVVGLGLIGGSFAMALKDLKPKNLWGIDIDEDTIKTAEELNIIDKGYIDPKVPLEDSDIVIICLYPELTIKFIEDNIDYFKSRAIITDAAGIKERLIEKINSFIREDLDFIGGHPMAGKELSGLKAASKDIFDGANYIITPTNNNKKENIDLIEKIIRKIGFKEVVKVSPEEHDEIIAFTSHLPHILAISLIGSDTIENTNSFIGGSFKDATRVAKINSELWSELLMDNSKNVIKHIETFESKVASIKRIIANNDKGSLRSMFEEVKVKKEGMI